MTIAARIRERLGELGITQAELAARAEISLNLVESLLAGTRQDPRLSTALKIARALRVPLGWLAGEKTQDAKRPHVELTPEEDTEFIRMWLAGASYHEFVQRFGINRWSIGGIRRRLELPSRPQGRPWPK